MDYRKAAHHFLNVRAPVFFLVLVLFFGAWVRFEGITEQGIGTGDNCRYVREAVLWAKGQPPDFLHGNFYRPVSYFLQGTAVRVFGYNDYSIKLLHGIMDLGSIALIFFIAFLLTGNYWVGAASSLLYAFLPTVVEFSRSELLHVESTFFVLLTLLFFVLFSRRETGTGKRKRVSFLLLFLSGFCSGLAANTHADLAFLAPGYVLYILIKTYDPQNKKKFLKESFILAFIFTFSFFTPYLLGFLLFGTDKVLQVFFAEFSLVKGLMPVVSGRKSGLHIFFNVFYLLIKYYFGKQYFLTGTVMAGAFVIPIYRKLKKEKDSPSAYLPLILIFSYAFLYSSFIDSPAPGRVLMPLLPLALLFITQWYSKITGQLPGKFSPSVFIFLFFALFLLNPKDVPGKTKQEYKQPHRAVFDFLGNDVNPENRLLITPAVVISTDQRYRHDFYFGNNAVYQINLPVKGEFNLTSFTELLKPRHIRYIFVGTELHARYLNPDFPLPGKRFHQWLRNEKFRYSLEEDLDIIHSYIREKRGVLIFSNRICNIYYLPHEDLLLKKNGLVTNGSFEHWWKNLRPLGEWTLLSGEISMSEEATDGLYSLRLEPAGENASRITWTHEGPLDISPGIPGIPGNGPMLRARFDAKASEAGTFFFYFRALIDGKWERLKPGILWHPGNGEWVTFSEDIEPVKGMKDLTLDIWLQAGAEKPAFVDNVSVAAVEQRVKNNPTGG